MVLLALSAVLPAFHVEVLAFSLEKAGVRKAPRLASGLSRLPKTSPSLMSREKSPRRRGRSLELPLGVQATGTGAEDQKLCLTSSTCRNSRKSRIRSDSRVICSKAESHTKRSRTLNGRALLIRPAPHGMGAAMSTGQGWGGGRKGARAGPSCTMSGVSPHWWRSTAAVRTEGVACGGRLQS